MDSATNTPTNPPVPPPSDDPLATYNPQISTNPQEEHKGFFGNLSTHVVDFIQTLVVFGAIFALIYLFVAQPHKVSGLSMFPTFDNGDYIMTDKISYKLHEPQRSDVIVLKNPRDESQDFIKRIIAFPGDMVEISNGQVIVNNETLQEDYLPPGITTLPGNFLNEGESIKVPENQYIVIGDNRSHSSDSREWGGVTKEEIIGKVFFRYWPPKSLGLFKHRPSD